MKENVPPFNCIIMSGNNATLFTICGTEIIQHLNIEVNLPNKHNRGGQSRLRFERQGEEARHNYITKVIEAILRTFSKDVPLVVGGSAYLKNRMADRLSEIAVAPKVIRIVDIQYDKRPGLYELLDICQDLILSIRVASERKWISEFMNSIAINDGLSVYGDKTVMSCLEGGLLRILMIHESVNVSDEIKDMCNKFGTELIILSNFLPESNQIKEGFGGIIGILRYPIYQVDDYSSLQDDISEEFVY